MATGAPKAADPSERGALEPLRPLDVVVEKPKKRPRVEVQAATDDAPPSEWGSLLGDLARPSSPLVGELEVDWRIHDKTHLEFAIDYPFGREGVKYTWEAFFFVPDSFRLDGTTYDKKEMYEDLQSYVRLAVPDVPFEDLFVAPKEAKEEDATTRLTPTFLTELEASIELARGAEDDSEPSRVAIRRARTYACLVRAAGLARQRELLDAIAVAAEPREVTKLVGAFLRTSRGVASSLRLVIERASKLDLPPELLVALRWVDEDISLVLETLAATASIKVQERADRDPRWCEIAGRLAGEAVAEARYRERASYPSVGRSDASARDVEHIEFRRHMLRRFTSSVLWLKNEVRDGASWVLQGLYAAAAALAMGFAFVATTRANESSNFYLLMFLVVASYAIKDRMKALLQLWFSRWAERRFPNRKWTIRDPERKTTVGIVLERAGFSPFSSLPKKVLEARRLTREHALEECARPEAVLWHEKTVELHKPEVGRLPSPMLTEIFRLNIGPWLHHTDDANRSITFADPSSASVYSAIARRVYNINVVYRLRRENAEPHWKRIRVVVSRKGIERIDPIC